MVWMSFFVCYCYFLTKFKCLLNRFQFEECMKRGKRIRFLYNFNRRWGLDLVLFLSLNFHFHFLSCHWASKKGRLGTRTPKPMTFGRRLVTPWTALKCGGISFSQSFLPLIPLPFACGTCASLSLLWFFLDFSLLLLLLVLSLSLSLLFLPLTFSSRVQVHTAPGLTFHLSFSGVTSSDTFKYTFTFSKLKLPFSHFPSSILQLANIFIPTYARSFPLTRIIHQLTISPAFHLCQFISFFFSSSFN